MENKKAKCLNCVFNQEFAWEGKTYYKFLSVFDNGDTGYCTVAVKEPPFKAGEEAEYTIEPGKKEGEFKIKKAKTDGGGVKKGFGAPRKTKVDYLTESLAFNMSYVKDVIVMGGIKPTEKQSLTDLWIKTVKELQKYSEEKIKEYLSE